MNEELKVTFRDLFVPGRPLPAVLSEVSSGEGRFGPYLRLVWEIMGSDGRTTREISELVSISESTSSKLARRLRALGESVDNGITVNLDDLVGRKAAVILEERDGWLEIADARTLESATTQVPF